MDLCIYARGRVHHLLRDFAVALQTTYGWRVTVTLRCVTNPQQAVMMSRLDHRARVPSPQAVLSPSSYCCLQSDLMQHNRNLMLVVVVPQNVALVELNLRVTRRVASGR